MRPPQIIPSEPQNDIKVISPEENKDIENSLKQESELSELNCHLFLKTHQNPKFAITPEKTSEKKYLSPFSTQRKIFDGKSRNLLSASGQESQNRKLVTFSSDAEIKTVNANSKMILM